MVGLNTFNYEMAFMFMRNIYYHINYLNNNLLIYQFIFLKQFI